MLKSWWDRLTEELNKKDEVKKNRTKTLQWLVIVACVAVAMIVISNFVNVREDMVSPREPPPDDPEETTTASAGSQQMQSIEDYEDKMAAELSDLLEKVVGLEQVSVQINLQSTEVTVLEKNVVKRKQVTEEHDNQGGKRTVTDTNEDSQVVTVQGKGGEEPIVVKRLKPDVKGIMIVAKGAENLEVKDAVMKAVRAFLDVPPHKIAILPKG